jgi:integrase
MKKANFEFIHNRKRNEMIELRVSFDRNTRTYISTKIKVPEKYWDNAKHAVKGSFVNSDNINAALQQMKAKYEAVEYDCIVRGEEFTKVALTVAVQGDKPTQDGLLAFIKEQLPAESARRNYSYGTAKAMQSFCNAIADFEKDWGKTLTFANFDKDALDALDLWLKTKFAPETYRKRITYVKMYVELAIRQKKMKENPFSDFTITRTKPEQKRDALSFDDLTRLEALAASGTLEPTMQIVADRFLLSCYCGLRISDSADLRRTDITKDFEGDLVIDRITIKTKTRVILPLHELFGGKPEHIIIKYMSRNTCSEFVFPPLSDQKTNIYLKMIAGYAQLDKKSLSFHIARHTCATMLAELTGNPYLIMQILGHADIKMSLTYVHNSYAAVVRSLKNVKWQ